jgi:hypothetical protein
MSTWFTPHDAAELVKIRYNFACVVVLSGIKVSKVLPLPQTHAPLKEATL